MTTHLDRKLENTKSDAKHLALESTHERLGADFRDEDNWRIPASYGSGNEEYWAVRNGGAGLIDLSSRGRIRVSGSEAVLFLNGLITNDVKTLPEHRWMTAVFPNVQGRLLAAVRVARLKDELTGKHPQPVFLLDVEAASHETVMKTIGRFTLAGDFHVADITDTTIQVSVQGKNAAAIVAKVLGSSIGEMALDGVTELESHQHPVTVIRSTHTSEDGFDLITETSAAAALWSSLAETGARPVGHDALEVLRIEAGLPRFTRDMDETNVVNETNLDQAISFTKGCYIGQEIIIRIKHRGHVAKKLTGLLFENAEAIEPGATILSNENKEIGRVTSATFSPELGKSVALGYIRYEYLTPGTSVRVNAHKDTASAMVHQLPFVRGSWYED